MRSRALFTTFALVAALAVTTVPGSSSVPRAAAAGLELPNVKVRLQNVASGACLYAGYPSTPAACSSSQQWKVLPFIENPVASFEAQRWALQWSNGQCLGQSTHVSDCSLGSPSQSFYFVATSAPGGGAAFYNLKMRSDTLSPTDDFCLGATQAAITMSACNGSEAQRWLVSSDQYNTAAQYSTAALHSKPLVQSVARTVLHDATNYWAADMFGKPAPAKVYAYAGGKVVYVSNALNDGSCGNGVQIIDALGFHYTYCHGATWPAVQGGAYVNAGTYLFDEGSTGTSTRHLHFEMRWKAPYETSFATSAAGFLPYCLQPVLLRTYQNSGTVSSMRQAQSRNGEPLGANCDDALDFAAPVIDSFKVTTASPLPVRGGPVTLSVTSRWVQSLHVYTTLNGQPNTEVGSAVVAESPTGDSRTTNIVVQLPVNTGSTDKLYTFTLKATGVGADSTELWQRNVAVKSGPLVTSAVQTSAPLPTAGGPVTVRATVNSLATSVTFDVSPAVPGYTPTPIAKVSNAADLQLTLPPNNTATAQTYTFTARPNGLTEGATSVSVLVPPAAGGLELVTPWRLLDTRQLTPPNLLSAGQEYQIDLLALGAQQRGIPADASALQVVVAAVGNTAAGYFTVYPCALGRPTISTLNFLANAGATANSAMVMPDSSGKICLYTSVPAHAVVDVSGYVSSSSPGRFNPITPARQLDSRQTGGRLVGGTSRKVTLPSWSASMSATAAALYVTVVSPAAGGFLNLFAPDASGVCGSPPPTSVLNYDPILSVVRGNSLIVPISAAGSVCVFTSAATDVIIDLSGWISPTGGLVFQPLPPRRILDTRPTLLSAGALPVNATAAIPSLPTDAVLAFNLIALAPTAGGYTTLDSAVPPRTAALNFTAGQTTAVTAFAQLVAGSFTLSTYLSPAAGNTYGLIVDVMGAWVPAI